MDPKRRRFIRKYGAGPAVMLCVAALGAAAPTALATTKIPTTFQSAQPRAAKPSRIQVGNISYISGIRWSTWGSGRARGRGTYHACDSQGNCRSSRVTLRASSRNWCANGYLYERLRLTGRGRGLPLAHSWRSFCGHGGLLG